MKKPWVRPDSPIIVDVPEKKDEVIWSRESRENQEFAKACFRCFCVYVLYKAIFVDTLGSTLYTCVTAVGGIWFSEKGKKGWDPNFAIG